LKSAVFEAIKSTLGKIEDLGNTFTPSESNEPWYKLVRTAASTVSAPADEDVLMRSSDTAPIDEAASESTGRPNALIVSLTDDLLDESATGRSHENIIVSYLDVICRVIKFLILLSSYELNLCFKVFGRPFPAHVSLQGLHLEL
jgi:E3 ubiquitin-protein ligase HUWE1